MTENNEQRLTEEQEKKLTDRINELYHKKEAQGLTKEEEEERQKLHKEFIRILYNQITNIATYFLGKI